MLNEISYDREKTVAYARQWATSRNPKYYSFDGMGGDCTNFASQCVFAGCGVMNYQKDTGWYYNSPGDRTASWSGVEYLHDFLVGNHGPGPFAVETDPSGIRPGDLVQLGNGARFYHTPVVVAVEKDGIYVAAHTYDVYMKPLDRYFFSQVRYLHIAGARKWK
ncbi:putative amidase domain protein [Caprobacter fermentans]|uniref:Amidase domain-containing protein n=1 Tax=Caproicibacter fermentans TaxID=2576756 RepID=A0A6N8HUW2_9FIRM|nr:amidase domain-containing protein [Caproicibacter fermentans]MVB09584.1 putative amidase domain protein [Caproicibacter fermentans]OCN01821.1 amidase [Clostridium sp. W14A]QNK40060.1 amidase domain-containing protein [Caproicibacter fermentans]